MSHSLTRALSAWLTVPLLAALLVAAPPDATVAHAADPDWIITLDADGPSTDHTRMRQGVNMRWHNRSGGDLTLTSPDGVLDSGTIPDGGSFWAQLSHAGQYSWETEVGGGTIQIYFEFDGDARRPVAGQIPDLAFPPRPEGDVALHPDLVAQASRTRALVTFADGATVDDADDALSDAGVDIIGGLPSTGIVLVSVSRDPGNFRLIDGAVERLRGDPRIAAAAHEIVPSESSLPAPTSEAFTDAWNWRWDPLSTEPAGAGGNWTHEISRVPAAWNLTESVTNRGGTRPATVVVDSGFETHEDLSRLNVLELCQSRLASAALTLDVAKRCTSLAPSDHGNHVAGIVGADHDERRADGTSIGVPGTDTLSRLYGLSRGMPGGLTVLSDDEDSGGFVAYELLLRELQADRLTDVRVINHSTTLMDYKREAWRDARGSDTCGPGAADDDTGSGTCFPDTHDPSIEEMVNHGRIMRDVVEAYVNGLEDPPLFVAAAGNDGATFCPGLALECDTPRPLPTTAASTMSWASRHWEDLEANPILIVESIGRLVDGRVTPGTQRSGFSNLGGDIAAPGLAVSTGSAEAKSCPEGSNSYCYQQGTSQAAPQVAGIAGMLANWDPTLSAAQLKQLLLHWARADTSDGASPRVDAYLPLLSLPGAARAVVDVNDPSADGNRRVRYGPEGATTLDETLSSVEGHATDPDGVVDMRDFRRFRDAWLAGCLVDRTAGCPDSVDLDGPADHPKRDLNQDGCHGLHAPSSGRRCPSEATWSRFDFNGDGVVTRDRSTLVGLTEDGLPAAGPDDAVSLTDLEVLASQWDDQAPGAQGVAAADLHDLLESGELILHGDGLEQIADEVAIVIDAADDGERLFEGVLTPGGEPGIATLPADRVMDVSVVADGSSQRVELDLRQPALLAGEDRRVDLCGGLSLEVEPRSLRPDGGSAAVTARISSCGQDVSGLPVDLAVDPVATDGATLADTAPVTDQDGVATTTIDAGTAMNDYTVSAMVEVPLAPGVTVTRTAQARLRVADAYSYELLADDAPGSGYAWLRDPCSGSSKSDGCLLGPAVNAAGDVAFRAELANRTSPSVVAAGDGVDPTNPSTALDLTADALVPGSHVVDGPRINDDGEVVVATSLAETLSRQRSWIHRLFTAVPGTVTEVAAASTDAADEAPFERVHCPDTPALGEVTFAADLADGGRVVARPDGDGFRSGLGTALACPDLARDGTTATSSLRATGETDDRGFPTYEGLVLVGDDVQQERVAVAAAGEHGWTSVGGPALADTGQAVVFTGDRGDGGGVWLSVRDGAGLGDWQEPQLVAGANDGGGRPELGTAPDGSDRYFVDIADHDSGDLFRYGSSGGLATVHVPRAPAGIAGDRILVALLGTPNGAGDDFTDQPGLWTVPIDVVEDGGTLTYDVGRPVAAVQHGQALAGGVVEELAIRDALAVPDDATSVDDHWLVFAAEADLVGTDDDRSVLVRARWQGTATQDDGGLEAATAGTVHAAPTPVDDDDAADDAEDAEDARASVTVAAAEAAAEPTLEVLDGPHLAAVTIDDDDPVQGQPFAVTNRSRTLGGEPAWAVLDIDPDNTRWRAYDEGMPALLGPDEAMQVMNPEGTGRWRLNLGTPVVTETPRVSLLRFHVDVQRPPNQPPVVDLGGPHTMPVDGELHIDAEVADDHTWRVDVAMDYDGDGDFDDGATGYSRRGIQLDAAEVHDLVCGGTCVDGATHTIGLRAEDSDGGVTTATTTVTMSGTMDFTLRVQPTTLRVNPGDTGTAYATIEPVAGFEDEVELDVTGVPDDWSISTDRAQAPPTDLRIRVRPSSDAPEDVYELTVTARSGQLEHVDTFKVSTVFGLLPRCDIDVTGRVTDAATGEVLERVELNHTWPNRYTGDDGVYRYRHAFAEGFVVQKVRTWFEKPGYFANRGTMLLACGDEEHVHDVEMEPIPRAGIEGRAVVGLSNPVDTGRPVSSGEPVPNARASIRRVASTTADADGHFSLPDSVLMEYSPRTVTVEVNADGFWTGYGTATLEDAEHVDVGDIPMVQQCTGRVGGGRVVDQHGEPVPDAIVTSDDASASRRTDADGRFHFGGSEVLLGYNNTATNVGFIARPPAAWDLPSWVRAGAWDTIRRCGEESAPVTITMDRPEPPQEHFASLDVVVTDEETGQPIEGAEVRVSHGGTTTTDVDGEVHYDEVLVGEGEVTSVTRTVSARLDGYWSTSTPVLLEAGETATVALTLLAERTGSIAGQVLDRTTGDPVPGARVTTNAIGGSHRAAISDDDGAFRFDALELGNRNADLTYWIRAELEAEDGDGYVYWPDRVRAVTVQAGRTTEQDVRLLRVCDGATIRGVVVNAETMEPLEDVTVHVGGDHQRVRTDADGRFAIPDIDAADGNEARTVTVHAGKAGFFGASKDVTVFCDAEVTVDFGTPNAGFGTVVGTVTDEATGEPVEGVFVGTEFGGSDVTDAAGHYRIERAPLEHDGSQRDWTVTAIGDRDRQEATVTVAADEEVRQDFVLGGSNAPPVAEARAVTTVQDQPVGLTLAGEDPDGDHLTHEVVEEPVNGTLEGTGADRTYTPDAGFVGQDQLRYVVHDGRDGSDPATITITVEAASNAPPVLQLPGDRTITAGRDAALAVLATDDDGDTLHLSAEGLPDWIEFSDDGEGTGTLHVSTEASLAGQSATVTVRASDGTAEVHEDLTVDVVAAPVGNRAPTAVLEPLEPLLEGEELVLDASASSDPDEDALAFRWDVDEDRRTGRLVRVATSDDAQLPIVLEVRDPAGLHDQLRAVAVVLNVAPTVQLQELRPGDAEDGTATVDAGRVFTLSGRFSDPGTDDTHDVTIDWGDGTSQALAHGAARELRGQHVYDDPGTYGVTVEVCDDDGGCGARDVMVRVLAATVGADEPDPGPDAGNDVRGAVDAAADLPATGSHSAWLLVLAFLSVGLGAAVLRVRPAGGRQRP